MAVGVRWWWLPVALMALVLSLASRDVVEQQAGGAAAVMASALPDEVAVRDASGRREPLSLVGAQALVLTMPKWLVGERVGMRVWRRVDGVRESEPWLTLRPRVRGDATIPFAGLAAGDYVVEIAPVQGTIWPPRDVQVPGRYAFAAAMPPR